LFADATNSCAKDVESRTDGGDLPIMKLKGKGKDRVKRGASKKRKLEVVMPVATQRELEVDVFT